MNVARAKELIVEHASLRKSAFAAAATRPPSVGSPIRSPSRMVLSLHRAAACSARRTAGSEPASASTVPSVP